VGQGCDQTDQDQVAEEVEQGRDGERRQVVGAEGSVTAQELVDPAGDRHEQGVLADVEHDLLRRGPAEQVRDQDRQGDGDDGRRRAPAEQDRERERLGGRDRLGASGDLRQDRQALHDHQAGQQHPEQGWLPQHGRRALDQDQEDDQAQPDRRDGEHVGVQR
jgi:hypothetical protein